MPVASERQDSDGEAGANAVQRWTVVVSERGLSRISTSDLG